MEEQKAGSEAIQEQKFIIFHLREEVFAFPHGAVIEIIEVPQLTKFSGLPEFCRGVGTYMKKGLTVIDTNYIVKKTRSEFTVNTCLLICSFLVNQTELNAGFLVDSLKELLKIEKEENGRAVINWADVDYAKEHILWDGLKINVLDPHLLLSEADLASLVETLKKYAL